jgi:hypothetical protein
LGGRNCPPKRKPRRAQSGREKKREREKEGERKRGRETKREREKEGERIKRERESEGEEFLSGERELRVPSAKKPARGCFPAPPVGLVWRELEQFAIATHLIGWRASRAAPDVPSQGETHPWPE